MGDSRGAYRDFMREPERNKHLEDINVYGRIILRRIFKKWNWRSWTGIIRFRTGTGVGLL